MEPASAGEIADTLVAPPTGRTLRLTDRAQQMVRKELGREAQLQVEVRRGVIVERVLAALEESSADALAIGFHRGGPPGVLEGGSIARRLAHTAPGALLTVPL